MQRTYTNQTAITQARNERRRARYAQDAGYRDHVQQQNRERYRSRAQAVQRTCEDNIAKLPIMCTSRFVAGRTATVDTFSVAELADALGGYRKSILYSWIHSGKFPRPTHATQHSSGNDMCVYTLAEAKALLRVFADHQSTKMYFHKRDVKTIRALYRAVKAQPPTDITA